MSIPLPPLPNFHGYNHYCLTEDQLRARDLEIARVVLEAAAKIVAGKAHKYDGDMEGADYDDFIRADWAAGAMRQLHKDLNALEFKHAE